MGGLLCVATGYLRALPPLVAAAMTWCRSIGLVIIALGFQFTTSYTGNVAVLPVIMTALIIGGGSAHSRIGAESFEIGAVQISRPVVILDPYFALADPPIGNPTLGTI